MKGLNLHIEIIHSNERTIVIVLAIASQTLPSIKEKILTGSKGLGNRLQVNKRTQSNKSVRCELVEARKKYIEVRKLHASLTTTEETHTSSDSPPNPAY